MKLHLPSGLRKALLACLTAVSVALPPTLGSASGIAAVFAAASVMAPQQVAAYTVTDHTVWESLFEQGASASEDAAGKAVVIEQTSTGSTYLRVADDTIEADSPFDADAEISDGSGDYAYEIIGEFPGESRDDLRYYLADGGYMLIADALTWTNEKWQGEATGTVWEQQGDDPGVVPNDDGWMDNKHFKSGDSATFGNAEVQGAQEGTVRLKGAIKAMSVTIAVGEWTWDTENSGVAGWVNGTLTTNTLTVNADATLTLLAGGAGQINMGKVKVEAGGTLRVHVGNGQIGGTITGLRIAVTDQNSDPKVLNGTLEVELTGNTGELDWNGAGGLDLSYVGDVFLAGAVKRDANVKNELKLTNGEPTEGDDAHSVRRRVNFDQDYSDMLSGVDQLTIGKGIEVYYAMSSGDTLKTKNGHTVGVNLDGGRIFIEKCDAQIDGTVHVVGDVSTLDVRTRYTVTLGGDLEVGGSMNVRGNGVFVANGNVTVDENKTLTFGLEGKGADGTPVLSDTAGNAYLHGAVKLSGGMTVNKGYDVELTGALSMGDNSDMTLTDEGSEVIFGDGFSVAAPDGSEASTGAITVGAGTTLRNGQMAGKDSIDMQQIKVTVEDGDTPDALDGDGTLDVGVNGMTLYWLSGAGRITSKAKDGDDEISGGTLTLRDGHAGDEENPRKFDGTVESNLTYDAADETANMYEVNVFTGKKLHVQGGELTVNTVTGSASADGRSEHTVQVDAGQILHVGTLSGRVQSVAVGDGGKLLSKVNDETGDGTGNLGGVIGSLTMGVGSTLNVVELSAQINVDLRVNSGTAEGKTVFNVGTLSSTGIPSLIMGDYVESDVGKLTGNVGTWTVGSNSTINVGTWSGKVDSLALGTGTVAKVGELSNARIGTLTLNDSRLELGNGTLILSKLTVGAGGGAISIQMASETGGTIFADSLFNHVSCEGEDGQVTLEVELADIDELKDHKYHLFGGSDDGRLTEAKAWFEKYFELSCVIGEGDDLHSENDRGRWDVSLDEKGWLTFTEKAMDLKWTATGGGEGKETLTWKVGGTAAESGWDEQEIFRKGDKVTFTAEDNLSNTVTLEQAIEAETVLVESGVFNFGTKVGVTDATLTVTDSMTVGSGATAVVNCGLCVTTLNLNGRLELGVGAPNVEKLVVGEEGTIHIQMDQDNTKATTFKRHLLDTGIVTGTATLEVELADVLALTESTNADGREQRKYHLFVDAGSNSLLTDAEWKMFRTIFPLLESGEDSIVILPTEGDTAHSSNDLKRWDIDFDKEGNLIFTEKAVDLTWTIDEAEEHELTWKDGGTTTESGWDGHEIFRQGDKVTFTVDTTADGHDAGPYNVTVEGQIEAGQMTVSGGVFNFKSAPPQEEASAAETEGAGLTVTGDLTVKEGATASVNCSLDAQGTTGVGGELTLAGTSTVATLTGNGTLTSSGQTGSVTVTDAGQFMGTLGVVGDGQLTLGKGLTGSATTLDLNKGTITLAGGANTLDTGKVKVEESGGTLGFGTASTDNTLTATLEGGDGAGKLTLASGTFNLTGTTTGEVALQARTTLTGSGDAGLTVAGVSGGELSSTKLDGKVTLTGSATGEGTYAYAGGFGDDANLTVKGGTHTYTAANQTIKSLLISGGTLAWGEGETATELNITGGSLTWKGNLTVGKLGGTVALGNADKTNTLTLKGAGGGAYTGALTLGTLDVQAGTHTVADVNSGTLKVAADATLVTTGTLAVNGVLAEGTATGTVVLQNATLSLADGLNELGTLRVTGAEGNLQLAGGSLATTLDGSGVLHVTSGEAGAALILDGKTNAGVTVDLGENTRLRGSGATLERVTGAGRIEATELSLTGSGTDGGGFSGTIANGAGVTLKEDGNWKLGDGACIEGTLTTDGTLTLDGKVVLKHQMVVGTTGQLVGGTLDIQILNADAAKAGGAIVLNGPVGTETIGKDVHITFSEGAAVGDDSRWRYQLFNDLSAVDFGETGWDAFREGVLGVLGNPSEQYPNFQYSLGKDGVLSIVIEKDGVQHWLEGDEAFTWKNESGEKYNKWTVGIDEEHNTPAGGQEFSPLQDVEFAGKNGGQIRVTVDGDIELGGKEMTVSGRNGGKNYLFELEKGADELNAGSLIIEEEVTAKFAVNARAVGVTVGTTTVNGTLVLSGNGVRNFGDVTVNGGASVRVERQGGSLTGQVHGEGTLYFDCGTADTSIISAGDGHTLENVKVVAGTNLKLDGESQAPLGHITNLKVNDGASLTVSAAEAVAGAKNLNVHLSGAGVGGSGALVVEEKLGDVQMVGWNVTMDAATTFSVGAGSTLHYDGTLGFGADPWLTKIGDGVLDFTGGFNTPEGTAPGNFRVQQGTLKFSYKDGGLEALGTVTLSPGATLESTITGTLGTLSGSGSLKVSGGALTVTNMTQEKLGTVAFSGGGSLDVGGQTLTGNTLAVGAGGGTLHVAMTEGANNLNFGTLTQVDGGKLTLHLTGFGDVFPTAETAGTYQLFEATNFGVLWNKLARDNPEATWRDYFELDVEVTNRLQVELGTTEETYGQLNFTMIDGIVWQGGGDQTWTGNDADWENGEAPGENDNVTFNGAGQGEVSLDGDVRAKDVWVESGSYTFTGKPGGEEPDTLTLTGGNLVVQGGARLNLNVGLGTSSPDGMLVVLHGDGISGFGTLNVQEQGGLGDNVHVQFEGGQLLFDNTSNAGDLSGKVLADSSTSGVRVKVVGADAKGNAWGRGNMQQGNAPSDGVALALEKGIAKSGDGTFTLYWKDSGETTHAGTVDVTEGTLTLGVTGETTLGGAVSLGGELDVKSTAKAALTGAVSGAGTLKATGGQVNLTGDTAGFHGTVAADNGSVLTLSGGAIPVNEGKGTVSLNVGGNGGTVAINGGSAEVTLSGQVGGTGAGVTLRNAGSGELLVSSNVNGSNAKLDGGAGGITFGAAASRATWAGSEVVGGDITLRNVTLQGGFKTKGGNAHIHVDTAPVNPNGAAPAAAAQADGGIVDMGGTNVGLLDGITVNREGEVRGLGSGTYKVGENKKLTLYFTAESWGKNEAEKGGMRALVQGSGFDIKLAEGNATEGGLQLAFDYDIVKWFRTEDTLYVHAVDGGTWNANGTVLDWANMEDSVAQLLQVVVGQNYKFTSDGLQLNGSAKDLYVVMDGTGSDPAVSNSPKDLAWDAENQEGKRSTVVLDGKTLTLKWDGATAAAGTPDGQIPNLLGSAGTHLQIQNVTVSGKQNANRLEVALSNTDQGGIRDGRFEGTDGTAHLPEADGTKVQGVDTTFLGSITGEVGVDLTKTGKGTLTVGGNYSLAEGTTKITEGALVLRGATNTLRNLEFAYTTAQDAAHKEARRGLELTGGGTTTVTGAIGEAANTAGGNDISVTKEAGLVLKDKESTLQSTRITGDKTGTLELAGKAGLTLAGDGTKRQLGGVAVQLGAEATLDTGKDKSELAALNGSGRLESTEGGEVTVQGESKFSGTLAASDEGVNAGKLKLADGAKFTFDNAKSAATGTANAWDVELGKKVSLTLDVSKKSGKVGDCLTLGDISLGNNQVTVDFGAKAIGEHYLAANLTNIGEDSSLTFHSDGMVKGDLRVDSGLTVLDPAARGSFGQHVHFTGVANFLTEQNVTVDGAGKVWFEYKQDADNKLLDSERGIPGAGKNGRAGANMVWDSLKGKSREQAFLDMMTHQESDYYRLAADLVRKYDSGNTGDMERTLTSVAGASIATLGPALAQDVHRQLKSIRDRAASVNNGGGADVNGTKLIHHVWINGETGYYKLEEDGYLPGFTLNSWGGTVGVDMNVGSSTVLALAVSAMYGDLEPQAAETADGSLDTIWLSGVVRTARGPWMHTLVLSGGTADAEINRTVNYGSDSYHTTGSTDGYAFGAMYEVGYTHLINKQGRSALQPIANIEWRHVSLDGYTEQGSDAGLSVNKISQDVITLGAGARLQAIVGENWVNHATLLETRALVKADIGDRSGTAENAILGMSDKGRSEVETAEIGAVGIEVGAGVTVPLGPRAGSVFADASVEWRSGWTALDATVGYKISF